MATQKTIPTIYEAHRFLASIDDVAQREDCMILCEKMKAVTGHEPVLWGSSIIGFGTYHYRYDSGHEGDAPLLSFAPRKKKITLYLAPGVGLQPDLLAKLGKHTVGKGCLYISKISDINMQVLESLLLFTAEYLVEKYSPNQS